MPEYRVSFDEIEDGVATFALFKDGDFQELVRYPVDDIPDGATVNDQFRPEFDDNGEIVALQYDEELTKREHEEYKEAMERRKEMLDDN
jgi:hypothetical protein